MKIPHRPLVNLACILHLIGASACSTPPPAPLSSSGVNARRELSERVKKSPEPAILFVGNSYSFGLPKAFSKLTAEQGKKVRVGHATYGGWCLEQHAKNPATLRKINNGRWDIVVLQEQSEIPAMSERKRASIMMPSLQKLVSQVRHVGAVPILYQTWGRRDGDKSFSNDDFYAMTQRLRIGYHAAAENAGGLLVVPVGDAWESVVSAGQGAALFMEDGSHPSPSGNQLIAQTFYNTIFAVPAGS